MSQAAEDMEFARAAGLRDRIRALAHVRAQQDINPDGIEEADIFSIAMEGGLSAVQVFFIRAGQNWGATVHFPRHEKGESDGEILAAFLVQFYDKRPPPRLILTNQGPSDRELIAEAAKDPTIPGVFDYDQVTPEHLNQNGICAGNPEEVTATAKRFESVGLDQLVMIPVTGWKCPQEKTLESVGVLGEKVLPGFRS